jgi:hypothetical protein
VCASTAGFGSPWSGSTQTCVDACELRFRANLYVSDFAAALAKFHEHKYEWQESMSDEGGPPRKQSENAAGIQEPHSRNGEHQS